MKSPLIAALILSVPLSYAQMPSSFDASGRTLTNPQQGNSSEPGAATEPSNPQLFGMEMPLLDPSSDTVSYNGAKFDVGNNAVVRARFEKYLQQAPDDSEESRRYRKSVQQILDTTQERRRDPKYVVGSDVLIKLGRKLYETGKYNADGGQCLSLASAIVSALDAQRSNYSRTQRNKQIDKDIARLQKETNVMENTNAMSQRAAAAAKKTFVPRNKTRVAYNQKDIITKGAEQVANKTQNAAQLVASKINYQSLMLGMLMQRRFDHVVIAARVYRHLFRDGDTRLNLDKNSDANKMFQDVSGMPPTVNTMDSLASNARRDADQSIQAVHNLLAQNKLASATTHLINAVAIGEYMQSVATFPAASRMRIAHYWSLRKRGLTALNARDYGTAEEIATEMKNIDIDFDDSLIMTYCTGKKRESNLHLRNAMKALQKGDDATFNKEIKQAGIIWPRNPRLDEGEEKLMDLDNKEPEKAEFQRLYARHDYRTIFNEQDRFEIVAIDPELKEQYKGVITQISTIDAMLAQLAEVAQQDRSMGPCVAYETLTSSMEEEPRYKHDERYMEALNRYTNDAHDFVSALKEAELCAKRNEIGSALSGYYRALSIYPNSKLAKQGADRISEIILKAQYK